MAVRHTVETCIKYMQVPVLKAHLKGKWIGGQEWRAGNKKRSELISDYRSVVLPSGCRAHRLPTR